MRHWPAAAAILIAVATVGCPEEDWPECGDGVLDPNEQCDDGNVINGDGCDAICRLECGNGRLDPGEECDDRNAEPGDGCDSECQLECGNGRLDPGEECDPSLTSDCTEECRWESQPFDLEVPEPGDTITVEGALEPGSPSWQRPSSTTCEQMSEDTFPYQGWVLYNAHNAVIPVTIEVRADGIGAGTLSDTMLFVYDGSMLPTAPLNCFAADDDGGEGRDSKLEGVRLQAQRLYFLTVTPFRTPPADEAYGTFELSITAE